ncbi:MAG: cofactor-independent phosphoglycerate mutase, partial [Desulfobulbaceae bacterium]|nr:cofactor-independent phosphoglycerate mutase [Desulfobulbaceae bacterium]
VGDGMGDLPIADLGGRTPLAAAHTPAMDHLAKNGDLYLLRTVPEGYPPGSDVANLSLAGYRPSDCYTGRAPLEAASMGVELAEGEIAFRCNLVTIAPQADGGVTMVDYSAGHISTDEARQLLETLERELGNDQICLYPGISYRHLLVYSGETNNLVTVPPHDHTGREVSEFRDRYQVVPPLAELMDKAAAILADHPVNQLRIKKGLNPANGIWLWGEGKAPSMQTMQEQFGVSGGLISAVDLLKGIGVYAGMEIIDVPGATGYLDTNYQGKVDAALAVLADKDLVFVHVEAPDEAGHQGLQAEKLQAIEDFDQRIVQPIIDGLAGTDFRVAVAMDHFTPLAIRTHSDQPVPVIIYDSRQQSEGSGLPYTEEAGVESGKVIADGKQFLEVLLAR